MKTARGYASPLLLIAILGIGTGLVYRPRGVAQENEGIGLNALPMTLGPWTAQTTPLSDDVLATLGAREYLLRAYRCGDTELTLYITYFDTGSGALTHNPEKCYTGSGWTFLDKRTARLPGAGQAVLLSTIARGDKRQRVVYWYQAGARVLVSKGRQIVDVAAKALAGRPAHSFVVSVAATVGDSDTERLTEELMAFAELAMTALAERVPS